MATLKSSAPVFQPRVLRAYSKWALSQEPFIVTIQRWWCRRRRLFPKNLVDCITLEPVEPPVFKHVSDSGYVTAFSALTLANYMVASGNFTHPQFRTPFNAVELRRLDKLTDCQYELCQNQQQILNQHQEARAVEGLQEFFTNDIQAVVQECMQMCQDNLHQEAELWWFALRGKIQELFLSLFALRDMNQILAHNVINQCIEDIEVELLRNLNNVMKQRYVLLMCFLHQVYLSI